MPYDEIVPKGPTKGSKPDSGGAILRTLPVLAIVKDNIDPIRAGRLRVYVGDFGGLDPNDSSNWLTVAYMTPFYGRTNGTAQKTGNGSFDTNPHSYGVWNSPPDIGSTVICIFINGDPNFGFYIGCVPDPEALHMVPAIGGSEFAIPNSGEAAGFGGATRVPVTNLNVNNASISDSANFLNVPKPIHSYVATTLAQQGLIKDPIRGVIGSSAQRETPSRVGWGVSTPGRPIYEGGYNDTTVANAVKKEGDKGLNVVARRGGHSIVMDDGDLLGRDQLIRLRTSLGHQILMSDDGQTLFIIHANGQSYIELGQEGTIDMYSTNSVNIRTQGDLNLHADNNININAKKDLNIYADNIKTNTENETSFRVGTNFSASASGTYTTKVKGAMSMESAGDASYASKAVTFINGNKKINLNTGSASLVPQDVQPLAQTPHTDTLYDNVKGWNAAPATLQSIVSRAPAHSPWDAANKGVDVKVSGSAADNLPAAPSPAVQAANDSANNNPTTQVAPVTAPVAATVPSPQAISAAVDKNNTAALVGQVAVAAATGDAADAVKKGADVVNTAAGPVAAIGKLAQSPKQLEEGGYLKPGSAARVDALISQGTPIDKAITPNMFTGQDGVNNLKDFVKSKTAQVASQVTNFQKSQTALENSGLITGKESPTQLGGLILATATAGISKTIDFVKNAVTNPLGAVSGIVTTVGGAATKALNTVLGPIGSMMSGGNIATNLGTTVMGKLSSLTDSVGALMKDPLASVSGLIEKTKGIAAGAYSAILAGLPKLKAGEPQQFREIAEKAAAQAQALGDKTPGTGILDKIKDGATKLVTDSVGKVTDVVKATVAGATKVIDNVVGSVKTIAGSATGMLGLPGGNKVASSIVDNAQDTLKNVPGADAVSSLIKTNALPDVAGLATNVTNNLNAATGDITNKLGKLKDGASSLTKIASAGLPVAAAAQLNNAMSQLAKDSPIPIKLPVLATNTFSRDGIQSQMTSLLGSSKIPLPNYKGNPVTQGNTPEQSTLQKQGETLTEIAKLTDKSFDLIKAERDARYALSESKKALPQGDPEIASLEAAYKAAKEAVAANDKQIASLRQGSNQA